MCGCAATEVDGLHGCAVQVVFALLQFLAQGMDVVVAQLE